MNKDVSPKVSIMFAISSLAAGVLFLIGGIRFHYRGDLVGFIIYIATAGLSFIVALGAYLSYRKKLVLEKKGNNLP